MNIQILGTAAAEGFPALFCHCEACKRARTAGGRNLRARTAALIDETMLIDLSPDLFHQTAEHGVDTSRIERILVTHSHVDHFAGFELGWLRQGFSARDGAPPIELYANSDVISRVDDSVVESGNLVLHQLEPFTPIQAGNYEIIPVLAKHGADTTPLNYIIAKGDTHLLYACDTGVYPESVFEQLAGLGIKFDMVISECTGGLAMVTYGTHLGLPNVEKIRARFLSMGLIDSTTPWILTHFTHNCGKTYDELLAALGDTPYTVAFDGMQLTC